MIKVHILFSHGKDLIPHASSYIRSLLPLTHPVNAEYFEVTSGTDLTGNPDVVIVERLWKSYVSSFDMAKNLIEQIRSKNAKLIYSIDDNLFDWEANFDEFSNVKFTTEQIMMIRYLARMADGIIVSTEDLGDRIKHLNASLFIIRNSIDERLFNADSLTSHKKNSINRNKVIGYMGTPTHDGDLMMVLSALRKTLRKYSEPIEFQLIKGTANPSFLDSLNGLPVRILDVGSNAHYLSFIPWMVQNVDWDIAIAPLQNNDFTRCKSDIKFLEYSAMNIAGIYSRVPSYERTVKHLQTGYLVENNTDAWADALELLINDDQLRQSLADEANRYVLKNRTLKNCAHLWQDAVISVMESEEKVNVN